MASSRPSRRDRARGPAPVVDPTGWNAGDALKWLDGHVNLESLGAPPQAPRRSSALALDRVRPLVELLGSPQASYPAIHLTGTNGKTSVARMVSALLHASGLSVGTYTSPHLQRVNERIAWNGEAIDDPTLAALLASMAPVEAHVMDRLDGDRPSYFEILTAAALGWFADVAVDVAVVEVGMGGGRDATNVVDGRVAVVTNVSIDHVEYLGPELAGIAAEKAGIVKERSTLVLGDVDPEIAPVFLGAGAASVAAYGIDFGVHADRPAHGGRVLDLWTPDTRYDEVFLPLHGAHQARNAAVAVAAAEAFLGRPLGHGVVDEALGAVRAPGRLEIVGRQPLVLLDGAHNVAGAHALRAALADEFPDAPRTLVVGLLREKDPSEMLEALGALDAARLVCCAPPSPRALDPDTVADAAAALGVERNRIEVVTSVEDAVTRALALAQPDEQVVVTGSLYVVGAARHRLVPE